MTTSGLVLSGGGSGPLAVMTDVGRSLSLLWPNPLPAPILSGVTATYAGVLPGVDLAVTANDQGGFNDTLVVKDASAAANPQLTTPTLSVPAADLTLATDAEGDLSAVPGPAADPVFTAMAPVMWDSSMTGPATPKSSTSKPASRSSATEVPHGGPFASSVRQPGVHAHTARGKTFGLARRSPNDDVSTGTMTLVPDPAMLTSSSTVFPVYIDPTWNPHYAHGALKAWGSVSSVGGGQNDYDGSYDPDHNILQIGDSGLGFVGRSYVQVGIDSALQNHATIMSSQINFPAQLCYGGSAIDMYWSAAISSPLTWADGPKPWDGGGHPISTWRSAGCKPGSQIGFDISSFIQQHAPGAAQQTFALRAPDESDFTQWIELNKSKMTMSTEYDHAPDLPAYPATSPGGRCRTSASSPSLIGNDDVTFSVIVNDPDRDNLGTEFKIFDSSGNLKIDTNGSKLVGTASGLAAQIPVSRTQFQSWSKTKATYKWYSGTTDGKLWSPSTGVGSVGTPCYFSYDPTAPPAPSVQIAPDAGVLGQPNAAHPAVPTFSVAPCAGTTDTPPTPCGGTAVARYTYQVNDGQPVTVTATGGVQSIGLHLTHLGTNTLTVTAISAAGNPGFSTPAVFSVDPPDTAYADGDIDGDGKPDLLAAGPGNQPGLWLGTSDGSGHLANPTNVGAEGTGISTDTSPLSWKGAITLHGDFSGDLVQDVVAYYPATGNAALLYGNGDALPLNPFAGSQQHPYLGAFTDPNNGANPADLVAAGNASLTHITLTFSAPDLIGIAGTGASAELDEWTGPGFNRYGDPNNPNAFTTLATPAQSPDGGGDWNNFTLTTAQPGGTTVLFALKATTGELWGSTNASQNATKLIGTPGTWTPITAPWTSGWKPGQLSLISGDINGSGAVELWTQAGQTATAYTLAGSTLTQEAANSLLAPAHEWPLADGDPATTAADTTGGMPATLSPNGVTWIGSNSGSNAGTDPIHGTVAEFDGKSGYLTMPQGLTGGSSAVTLTISFRAAPATPESPAGAGVIFATGTKNPDATPPDANAAPVMYIGSDGHLYAQFWDGTIDPMVSSTPVNDGQWHTATLVAPPVDVLGSFSQALYLDNHLPIFQATEGSISLPSPELDFAGDGVFNKGGWKNPPTSGYFHGELADIALYTQPLTQAQLAPRNVPAAMTGPITSQMTSSLCVDDRADGNSDGNAVQIYTCNGSAAQQWTFNPDGSINININGKCMDIAGANPANGSLIDVYTCDGGGPKQYWRIRSDGTLYSPDTGECLDDPGLSTKPGTQLDIWACTKGAKNQQWIPPTG